MNKTKTLSIILIILALIICFKKQEGCSQTDNLKVIKPPKVIINDPVVKPETIKIPKLKSNILYDDFNKTISLATLHKKKTVVIFSANWCKYCEILKQDLQDIAKVSDVIFCVLDIEKKDINSDTIQKLKPKSLPTTIILEGSKELSRKTGYRKKEYLLWLKQYSQ